MICKDLIQGYKLFNISIMAFFHSLPVFLNKYSKKEKMMLLFVSVISVGCCVIPRFILNTQSLYRVLKGSKGHIYYNNINTLYINSSRKNSAEQIDSSKSSDSSTCSTYPYSQRITCCHFLETGPLLPNTPFRVTCSQKRPHHDT